MPRKKKIDTAKISKAAKKVGAKGMQKIPGGRVIGKALNEAKRTKEGGMKQTYAEYSDYTKTYTKHTRHGKSW
jgi:hypothetical protein